MTITVEFSDGAVRTVSEDVRADGVPGDRDQAWAAAASDPAWVRDRDEFLAATAETPLEIVDELEDNA